MNQQTDQRPVMREIVAHLGQGWTTKPINEHEPDSDRQRLIATNGIIEFWFTARIDVNDRPEPYKVSSYYPRAANDEYIGHGQEMSIGIGRMKKPAQVARDIQRRFLDEYTPRYMAIIERVKASKRTANTLRATEEMIAAALDQKLHNDPYKAGDPRTITLSPYASHPVPYGEAKLNSYLVAEIKIRNAPPELVIQIGKVLQQAAKWQQAQQVKP